MPKQMNFQTTPEFERELELLMNRKGFKSRSEAVRQVVHEAAQASEAKPSLRQWLEDFHGIAAEGALPPFDDDELWAGTDPDIPEAIPPGISSNGESRDQA